MRGKIECYLSATLIGMKCLALTGTQHRVPGEDRTYLELSVLILFKMIESIDMTHSVISFLACCQGSKPVLESFSDIQCVFLEDSRRHCIFL